MSWKKQLDLDSDLEAMDLDSDSAVAGLVTSLVEITNYSLEL